MATNAGLSDEQEARRRAGLRMLARIIARQYLEQPPWCAATDDPAQGGNPEHTNVPKSKDGQMPDREQGR